MTRSSILHVALLVFAAATWGCGSESANLCSQTPNGGCGDTAAGVCNEAASTYATRCECKTGFQRGVGPSFACEDVSECANYAAGAAPCGVHGIGCSDTDGSYRCQCESGWGPQNGTNCDSIDCGQPPAPQYGSVSTPSGTTVGQSSTVSCIAGFTLSGTAVRDCLASGQWSGATPSCVPVDCGPLSAPTHGQVSAPKTTYPEMASYSCDSGYELSSTASRTCQTSGVWSGSQPTCLLIDCGAPASPTNGAVSAPQTLYGDVASYSCNAGYQLSGLTNRTCQSDRLWSGADPSCVDIDECLTTPCSNGGACVNSPGSFSCNCTSNWTGPTCIVDVDECTANTDNCAAIATCANTQGGFTCTCPMGYSGNGTACADIDECIAGNPCNEDSGAGTCTNSLGSYACACAAGYQPAGPGVTSPCVDVDECATNNGGCPIGATCSNTAGGRTCACPVNTTVCAGACVDLLTDENHCGACNFPVVGARTCVAGKPSNPWVMMTTANGPTDADYLSGYSGFHYLVMNANGVYQYDLASDLWSHTGIAFPFTWRPSAGNCGGSGMSAATVPTAGRFAVFNRTDAWLYEDSPSGGVFTGPYGSSAGAPATRSFVSTATDGRYVHLLFGADDCVQGRNPEYSLPYRDGGSFDVIARSWRSIPVTNKTDCSDTFARVFPTLAVANGVLMGVGRISNHNNTCYSTGNIRYDLTTQTWLDDQSVDATINYWYDPQLVSLGSQALLFGIWGVDRPNAWLIDPRGGSNPTTPPPASGAGRVYAWLAYTGRALLYWGGYSSIGPTKWSSGSAGTVSGSSITWRSLPTSVLSARGKYSEAEGSLGGSAQGAWTGRELIVYGGYDLTSARNDGARYQPPVGCVCPRAADTPATVPDVCTNVTNILDPNCIP